MSAIREDRQELSFDQSWQTLKWDQAVEFKGSMEKTFYEPLQGRSVKAVDVVGARRRGVGAPPLLLVAEFKDFNRPNLPPNARTSAAQQALTNELMRDVLAKVVDSLCGVTFAHDPSGGRSTESEAWRATASLRTVSVLVLICVEVPPSQAPTINVWTTELRKRLRWLGPRSAVIVTSSLRPYAGNGISYSLI
jgi:hypothetical protein